jgi:hypothetical protein
MLEDLASPHLLDLIRTQNSTCTFRATLLGYSHSLALPRARCVGGADVLCLGGLLVRSLDCLHDSSICVRRHLPHTTIADSAASQNDVLIVKYAWTWVSNSKTRPVSPEVSDSTGEARPGRHQAQSKIWKMTAAVQCQLQAVSSRLTCAYSNS